MIRRLGLFVIAAAALRISGLLPFESHDVAQLVPVEALTVSVKDSQVILRGEECEGRGEDWSAALEDLYQGAEGKVFLGTAEQVVFGAGAVELLPQVVESGVLRPAAVVCVCPGVPPEPESVSAYLGAHDGGVTLQRVQAALLQGEAIGLPVLAETEGGLRLYGAEPR